MSQSLAFENILLLQTNISKLVNILETSIPNRFLNFTRNQSKENNMY